MSRISALFKLCILTPGRRIFALRQMRKRAEARNLTPLLAHIDRAISYNQGVLERRQLRRRKKQNPRPIDQEIDRIIALIHARLDNFSKDTSNPELAKLVKTLLNILFAEGLAAHVRLPFIEQAEANARVLATFAKEEYQSLVPQLGLQQLIEQLAALNAEFSDAVSASFASANMASTVKADIHLGQDMYLTVVARVIAELIDDAAARADLLEPVIAQNEEIRGYRRRRRRVVDVDPATGEPAEDAETDSGDEADASGNLPDGTDAEEPDTDGADQADEGDEDEGGYDDDEADTPAA